MKNKWLPNFAEITDREITIKHWSTSSTIEIVLNDPNNIGPFSIHLDYGHFDSLIECIKSLEIDVPSREDQVQEAYLKGREDEQVYQGRHPYIGK